MLTLTAIAAQGPLLLDAVESPFATDEALPTRRVKAADFDGDGNIDIVLASGSALGSGTAVAGSGQVLLNDGAGSFASVPLPVAQVYLTDVECGDVDGDGDVDIVFSGSAAYSVQINAGGGTFVQGETGVAGFARDLVLRDLDGDGDLDLACARQSAPGLFLNDGSGSFVDVSNSNLPFISGNPTSVAALDVEGDGDTDLLFSGGGFRGNAIVINDGAAGFTFTAQQLTTDTLGVRSSIAVDVDGDRDTDVLMTTWNGRQNHLFLNDGVGNLLDASARLPATMADCLDIAHGDFNGDSAIDFVIAAEDGSPQILINDGAGGFVDEASARLPSVTVRANAVCAADLDGDGALDLYFGTETVDPVLVSDRAGSFASSEGRRLPFRDQNTTSIAVADIDGDGDLDVISGNSLRSSVTDDMKNRVYRNDGKGRFTEDLSSTIRGPNDETLVVMSADVDGDGDPDVLVGNQRDPMQLYTNDGAGTFRDVSASQLPSRPRGVQDIEAFDADGDGDIDLFVTRGSSDDNLLLNDGQGVFADATAQIPTRLRFTFGPSRAVDSGDMDLDGDLDLLIGVGSDFPATQGRNYVLANDGNGTFTYVGWNYFPRDNENTTDIAWTDIDNDGDLDVLWSNAASASASPINGFVNRVLLNDGAGRYNVDATAWQSAVANQTNAICVGDLNGDGLNDVLFGNGTSDRASGLVQGANRFLQNEAGMRFSEASQRMASFNQNTRSLACADIDGDGDLDIVLGNDGPNRVLLNLSRHLDSPAPLHPGQPHVLDVYAVHGASDSAVGLLSFGEVSIPAGPFGVLGVDPSRALALPMLSIPATTGQARWVVATPNDGGLLGFSLHAQALLFGTAHLSNVVSDRFR